jgi:hypothetical protein
MREGRARVKSVGCEVRGCGLAVWCIEGWEMSRNQAIFRDANLLMIMWFVREIGVVSATCATCRNGGP